jgi:hypothetical protein
MDWISYGEAHFYHGELIRCQSYDGDYVCSCGSVAMPGNDGMDSSTQIPAIRCAWALVATFYCARH